jgi:Flp pilus assembly protein TadG
MKRVLARAARDESGASAVELALTLTAFMLLVMGSIDYGLYLWTANALQQTAIQTARCMGVLQTGCTAAHAYSSTNTTTFAQGVASGYGLTLASADLNLSIAAGCGGQGTDNSSVTISYTFTGIATGLIPGISSKAMTAQACFPNQS